MLVLLSALLQRCLFAVAQLFDLPLPAHGGLAGGKGFKVKQFHWPAGAGVLGPGTGVVGGQPPFQVVGPAGIKRAVRAL